MLAETIRTLYGYGAWANARIFDVAERLDNAELLADANGHGSIRDTLVHVVAAEWLYLERWQGRSPRDLWDPAAFPDVAAIRHRWTEVDGEMYRLIARLTDEELARPISYVNFQGETWTYPLWQILLHQVNHATQHRSEVALRLTELGHSPGWLDFLFYIDETAP
jgi:uncharacterized damage-inducible protein DinB